VDIFSGNVDVTTLTQMLASILGLVLAAGVTWFIIDFGIALFYPLDAISRRKRAADRKDYASRAALIHEFYSPSSNAPLLKDGLVIEHRVKETKDYRTEDIAIRLGANGQTVFRWHHGYGHFAPGADYEDSGTRMAAVRSYAPGDWERSFESLWRATKPLATKREKERERACREDEKRQWGL